MRTRLDHIRAALLGECPEVRFADSKYCSLGRHHGGDHRYDRALPRRIDIKVTGTQLMSLDSQGNGHWAARRQA